MLKVFNLRINLFYTNLFIFILCIIPFSIGISDSFIRDQWGLFLILVLFAFLNTISLIMSYIILLLCNNGGYRTPLNTVILKLNHLLSLYVGLPIALLVLVLMFNNLIGIGGLLIFILSIAVLVIQTITQKNKLLPLKSIFAIMALCAILGILWFDLWFLFYYGRNW